MRPRSDGWTPERLEALLKARADQDFYAESVAEDARKSNREARMAAVMEKVAPLNKRVLHSRRLHRLRRAAAKVAKASRKANR